MLSLSRLDCWDSPLIFKSPESALVHLADHVLTWPEARWWRELIGAWPSIVGEEEDARWRCAQEAFRTEGRSAQALYDAAVEVVQQAAVDANTLGLWTDVGQKRVALGLDGVLLIVDRQQGALSAFYLPGQGHGERVKRSQVEAQDRLRDPLPREGPELTGHHQARSPREQRRDAARTAAWSPSQRIFYRLFRPAVQHIRGRHYDAALRRGEAKHLLEPLRAAGVCDFERWSEARQRLRK